MSKIFNVRDYNHIVDFTEYKPLTAMEAIKAHCKECYCWDVREMKQCDTTTCPFNQFLKNNFKRKINISEEDRLRRSNNMKKNTHNVCNEEL